MKRDDDDPRRTTSVSPLPERHLIKEKTGHLTQKKTLSAAAAAADIINQLCIVSLCRQRF